MNKLSHIVRLLAEATEELDALILHEDTEDAANLSRAGGQLVDVHNALYDILEEGK
jgi:hypothetical protein